MKEVKQYSMMKFDISVETEHPVALDSPDHIFPWGTARDNTTDIGFIKEAESYLRGASPTNHKIKTLDIGCSGGQLTIDFLERGHLAVGIEGSDYSVKHGRANWPAYHNFCLFTADATKPYRVLDKQNNIILFDLITSWEVIEHIHSDDFEIFFSNIKNHMHENSIFCGSINPYHDHVNQEMIKETNMDQEHMGLEIHQSVFTESSWFEILNKHFSSVEYMPFVNKVRYGGSFHILLKK
jgi:SAM-dependent methyltransferase